MKSIIFGLGVLLFLMVSVCADDESPTFKSVPGLKESDKKELKPALPEVPIPLEKQKKQSKMTSVIYTPVILRTDKSETLIAISTHDLAPGYNSGKMAEDYLGYDIKRRGKVGDVNATITIKMLPDAQLIIIILRYGDAKGPPQKQPKKKVQTRGAIV